MSSSPSWSQRAQQLGRAVETALLSLVLSAMILLAAAQILLRNFGDGGFAWADEALRILVLWVTMLGAVAASRDQRHVSIDALSRYLPDRGRRPARLLIDLFVAGICLTLAWYSWIFVSDALANDDRLLGGDVPAWSVQAIMPLTFVLLAYRYLIDALHPPPARRTGGDGH